MDLQDVTLKVLYDFEYSTKDGKFVRIQEGEKLFLIKKTNKDWWQVIRSSGKPFFVPATYVDVYKKISNGNKGNLENIIPTEKARCYSEGNDKGAFVSVKERANSIDNNSSIKQKPKVAKRTIFPVIPSYENIPADNEVSKEQASVIEAYQNLSFPTRIICIRDESESQKASPPPLSNEHEKIEEEEEADYVNLRPEGNGFVIENELSNSADSIETETCSVSSSSVLVPLNISTSKLSVSSSKSSLIDQVTEFPKNYSGSSTSLDGLSSKVSNEGINKEIVKSMSSDDINKHYTSNTQVNNLIRSFSHEPTSLPHYNTVPSISVSTDSPKLQHNGSFKTKYEREKFARKAHSNLQVDTKEIKPEESMRKKSLETVKESLNEISHTTYNFLDEEDASETPDEKVEGKGPPEKEEIVGQIQDIPHVDELVGEVQDIPEAEGLVGEAQDIPEAEGLVEEEKDIPEEERMVEEVTHDPGSNVKNIRAMLESQISSSDDVCKKSEPFKVSLVDISETSKDFKSSVEVLPASESEMSEKGSMNSLLELELGKSVQSTDDGKSVQSTDDGKSIQSTDDGDMSSDEKRQSKVMKDRDSKKRGTGLIRNRRVESYKLRLPVKGTSPPPQLAPVKELYDGWSEFATTDGRIYYCNKQTGEKSWKLPRKRCNTDEDGGARSGSGEDCASPSPVTEIPCLPLPQGWTPQIDLDTGLACYVNSASGVKWFSSNDREGRVYFFEENSCESSWTLPEVNTNDGTSLSRSVSQDLDASNVHPRHKPPSGDRQSRNAKTRSMILIDPNKAPTVAEPPPLSPLSKHWPQLWDGHMCVLREGTLARTKITEHGKRLKKNWATSHVVLTELFLLFFKDAKQFHAMKTGGCVGRPELCVDLNGALIDRGDKMSSRRHVYLISTVLTLQVLIQFESSSHADSWLLAIHNAIKNLPSGVDNCSRIFKNPSISSSSPDSSDNKKSKVCRSKSVKLKKEGSIEDLPASSAERQTKIKARLKKFFNRRPSMDHLVKKGIYKDEPAFGSSLDKVCPSESPRVPLFVKRCIQCIEKSEENMKTDGLYRASGNLSQVQKIRLQVDQNNLSVLDEEEDVHVLAGALKLFFRELKEPLIPYHAFNKALKASTNHNRKEKLQLLRDIIRSLPPPNYDTFRFLLEHLRRVTQYKEFNRMHIPNLAIVFGPSLMWSEQESKNMALDFMQQNLVIECFLVEFEKVFR